LYLTLTFVALWVEDSARAKFLCQPPSVSAGRRVERWAGFTAEGVKAQADENTVWEIPYQGVAPAIVELSLLAIALQKLLTSPEPLQYGWSEVVAPVHTPSLVPAFGTSIEPLLVLNPTVKVTIAKEKWNVDHSAVAILGCCDVDEAIGG